ncbi:MAG: hypothetical protein MR018_02050 [Clostridiales bacterium]|nr:hypothetical protein [Clostridiales bacterium]
MDPSIQYIQQYIIAQADTNFQEKNRTKSYFFQHIQDARPKSGGRMLGAESWKKIRAERKKGLTKAMESGIISLVLDGAVLLR